MFRPTSSRTDVARATLASLSCSVALLLGSLDAGADEIARWTFDEAKGTTAFDSVGSLDGTLLGGASFAPGEGVADGAVRLDRATDDVVSFGDVFSFVGADAFSISVWFRVDRNDPSTVVVSRHLAGTLNGYLVGLTPSGGYGQPETPYFYVADNPGAQLDAETTVIDDEWHLLVVTWQAGARRTISIDGAPIEAASAAPAMVERDVDFLAGGVFFDDVPGSLFTGLIDELRVFDHVLTCEQIQLLYERPGDALPPAGATGDLDGDGDVSGADLAIMLGSWGACAGCAADIDCDGAVDGGDLAVLLGAWTG